MSDMDMSKLYACHQKPTFVARKSVKMKSDGFHAFFSWFLMNDGRWAEIWFGPYASVQDAFSHANWKSPKPS